jgi:membrane dipeptidase
MFQDKTRSEQVPMVIDSTVPKFFPPVGPKILEQYINEMLAGGVNCCLATVAWIEDLKGAVNRIEAFAPVFERFKQKILHAVSVEDIERARRTNKVAIVFQFQGSGMIGNDLSRVAFFHSLGVRVIQLTYNWKFLVGDGCLERTDCGLTDTGVGLIKEMNRLGIVVDCTHTGYRTTMEAIELSRDPVIFSHSGARAVYPSLRNIRDEQIRAAAKKDGVIGVPAYGPFLTDGPPNTWLEKFIDHIDHMVRLVGPEHVGIGCDFTSKEYDEAYDPLLKEQVVFQRVLDTDRNRKTYPSIPDSGAFPAELQGHSQFRVIGQRLRARGYSPRDVQKILGENFLRVFRTVWRAA